MNQILHLQVALVLAFLLSIAGSIQASNHTNDQNLGINQLESLAGQDDISAQYELGVMYAEGRGVDKDLSKAKYYLDKVINSPNKTRPAFVNVAKIYWEMFELWDY